MHFPSRLLEGTLVRRYKRFLADVILADGTEITAHCPNTGSMKSCGEPGDKVFLSHNPSPKRRLAYTWELTATEGGFIGVNTARPNAVVEASIAAGRVPELAGYSTIRREVKYGQASRIDLLLSAPNQPPCYVEIKNATLLEESAVLFPDAVTARGQKHLEELSQVVQQGARAVIFFLINRPEGNIFRIADHIDPKYKTAFDQALKSGVEAIAYRADTSLEACLTGNRITIG